MNTNEEKKYDDIIHLSHHVSDTHPQMPLIDRAAQFAPFAALTGHTEAINKTEQQVVERVLLAEKGEKVDGFFEFGEEQS